MAQIDWLSIQQIHEGARLPRIAGSIVLHVDPDTGEQTREVLYGMEHEGSFDSRVRIRCDGQRVEISGNPSRYGRPDNLFGLGSVVDGVSVYNAILQEVDLPPFEFSDGNARHRIGDDTRQWFQGADREKWVGAKLTKVDICENYVTGFQADTDLILRSIGSMVHNGRKPQEYPGAVMWGKGSRYLAIKYYDKGKELRYRDRSPYRDRLSFWCSEQGLFRHEVGLRAMALAKLGLQHAANWSEEIMVSLLDRYAKHRAIGAGVSGLFGIAHVLEEEFGFKVARARRCQELAIAFGSGMDMRSSMSTASFYKYRRDLLKVGIDIAGSLNVTALSLKVREIAVRPAVAPDWYGQAA